MTPAPDGTILEDLPYDELRDRAFRVAEKHHDLGFFVDLFNHMPALNNVAAEGGSLGDVTATLTESIHAAREAFGEDSVGDFEPLFRARFATYIREKDGA